MLPECCLLSVPSFLRRTSPKRVQAYGMTLIEVLGALALMGSLVVSLLCAKANAMRQGAVAERRLQAVQLADQLLTEWWPSAEKFPRDQTGQADQLELAWRTRSVVNKDLEQIGTSVLCLEILEQRPATAGQVLASVEVVVPSTGFAR